MPAPGDARYWETGLPAPSDRIFGSCVCRCGAKLYVHEVTTHVEGAPTVKLALCPACDGPIARQS